MNGDVNHGGRHSQGPNGFHLKSEVGESSKQKSIPNQTMQNGVHEQDASRLLNGAPANNQGDMVAKRLLTGLKDMPPEIEQIAREHYVSLGTLIGQKAQNTWDTLLRKVDRLANIHVPVQVQLPGLSKPLINGVASNNTAANLDKKDELLNFANDQKADLIKLLVLLHWSKDVEAVSKVIDLNRWLRDRISHYSQVSDHFAVLKRYMASIQTPNPDLKTAAEVLSQHKVLGFSNLGYVPPKPITDKQALRTLRSLNNLLCSRLTLHEDLPLQLRRYRVHDGRVTFYVADEFELDVSILDEKPESQFYLADFRFAFSPSTEVPTGRLFDELCFSANDVLGKSGLMGCYEFLHDFALSVKINVLHNQAMELLQGQWSHNLKIEVVHKILTVQYWTNRQGSKSWIEIGLKSGRLKKQDGCHDPKGTSLGIRWMHASKEIENAEIEINTQNLSMDTILREVIALHSNRMFDSIFDKLLSIPVFASGDLEINQSASSTNPNDCYILVDLSKRKTIKISMETVTGAIVLTPTSALCSQKELELNRAKNLVEDMPQRLSFLRCQSAEADLMALAEASGWAVLRSFQTTTPETRALFPTHVLRITLLRCTFWETGYMVAATFSPDGDQWWLVEQDQAGANQGQWRSQLLQAKSRHVLIDLSPAYMQRMADYTTGLMIMQQNALHLNSMGIRCKLDPVPSFKETGDKIELPKISLDFQPAKLHAMLQTKLNTIDFTRHHLELSQGSGEPEQSWIRKALTIKYGGLDSANNRATLVVSGHSEAEEKTLRYLAKCIDDSDLEFSPQHGTFSFRFAAPVGKPTILDLLRRLLHLETIIACVEVVQATSSMTITSLSLSQIAIRYRAAPPKDLGLSLRFATSSSPLSLQLSPEHGNPHERIQNYLRKQLSDPQQKLSSTLTSLLPLLSHTHTLLTLFDQMQSEKYCESLGGTHGQDANRLVPRIHIMPRSTTTYAVQLYAPAGFTAPAPSGPHKATGMIGRFEILPHIRKGKNKWILRAAIEEFESYSQPSYCAQPLKDRIKAEIFAAEKPNGWLPLDSGASCDDDKPEPLLRALIEVVMAWMKDYSTNNIAPADGAEVVPAPAAAVAAPAVANGVQKGPNNNRTSNNVGKKANAQQAHEIITLD